MNTATVEFCYSVDGRQKQVAASDTPHALRQCILAPDRGLASQDAPIRPFPPRVSHPGRHCYM